MQKQTKIKGKEQSHKDCFFFFKDHIFLILGISIAVAICMYGIIGIIGFSIYPDEFGYWAVAAALTGHDWSEITGLGPYYSYGYSILLAPVLLLFHDPIVTYRMAIVLNLLLQCASFPMIYLVLKELFPDENKNVRSLITVVVALYPAWSYYTMTTMAESVLFFSFILAIFLMLKFLQKPGVITGLLLAAVLIFLYTVHMRCLGTIAAAALTLLIWAMTSFGTQKKKHGKGWILLILLVTLFAGTFLLKDRVIALLYHSASEDVMTWNDYSGLVYRVKKIVSYKGILYFVKDICGKALYLGLATYGIAYFGVACCAKRALTGFKRVRGKEGAAIDYLWIYIFLATLFQFMVALVYLNGASAPDSLRLDNFLHGRYIDFYLPVLIGIGLCYMLLEKNLIKKSGVVFLIYLALGAVAYQTIITNDTGMNTPHGFTMIGMSYLLKEPITGPQDTVSFLIREMLLSAVLTALATGIVLLSREKNRELIIGGIILIQVVLGINACDHYVFDCQSYIYGDMYIADKLRDVINEHPDRQVVHIYEEGLTYIDLVQFANRDTKISVVDTRGEYVDISGYLRDDYILIALLDGEYEQQIDEYYEEGWVAGHLGLYYTP